MKNNAIYDLRAARLNKASIRAFGLWFLRLVPEKEFAEYSLGALETLRFTERPACHFPASGVSKSRELFHGLSTSYHNKEVPWWGLSTKKTKIRHCGTSQPEPKARLFV